MGGKTQQRVAGNVKPTSSGRIRDLMINKQQGINNIITFSALSTPGHTTSSTDNDNNQMPIISYPQAPQVDVSDRKEQATTLDAITETTSNLILQDQPNLIVKKIGNRDYYMRIKPSKDSLKKPAQRKVFPFPGEGLVKTHSVNVKLDDSNSDKGSSEQASTLAKEESETKKESQEEYDFMDILDQITQYRSINKPLKAKSLDEVDDDRLEKEANFIKLLNILVLNFKEELSIEEWDLVNCNLTSFIKLILNSKQLTTSSNRTIFCVKVFSFIRLLMSLAESLKGKENIKEDHPMLQTVVDDWKNFHSSKEYQDLIVFYFRLISKDNLLTQEELQIIKSLAAVVVDVDPKMVIANPHVVSCLKSNVELDSDQEMPGFETRYCDIEGSNFRGFSAFCSLLRSNYRIITVTAHRMLSKMMESICNSVNISSMISDQVDLEKLLIAPPEPLMSLLISKDSMMSALLSDYQVGDISVTIEPNTDSYTCTLAYLFIWDLVVQFIVGVDKELGHRIIYCLKKMGLIQRLLDNAFMLVPPLGERGSLNFRFEADENCDYDDNQIWSLNEFLKSSLQASVKRPINEIELTSVHVYFSVALHMPVTVRKWYNNNSNKRLCNLVNEYTVKHISKVICSLEMESVQEKCNERADEDKMNNLVIRARPNAREVYAVYTRDEFRMELTIKLPINYPLGPVQIDGGKRVGVTDLKWRSWLLRLTTFLAHQNGPILDGVDLWRRNIDKRFEGIEKCMICFSILHSNYQLPKKKCQTCSKMFHNLCLYKWFDSSGNSTCPLCRNIW